MKLLTKGLKKYFSCRYFVLSLWHRLYTFCCREKTRARTTYLEGKIFDNWDQWYKMIWCFFMLNILKGPTRPPFCLFLFFFHKMGHSRPLFCLSTVNSKYVHYKISPMTGFEPWTSGIGSNRSTNWATTTAHYICSFERQIFRKKASAGFELGLSE